MKTFIDLLAEYLISQSSDLSKTIVIFPNRRPAVFLYRALGKLSNKPIFAPTCFSIRDFIYHNSSYRQTDNITLLFRLYHIYSGLNQPENTYAFEHFISSGEIMLADFNDIDNYMVDPGQLFSNLDEAKAIELWNPGKDSLTEKEKQYLSFFQNLYKYYDAYKTSLSGHHLAYDGMAYRTMAEEILQGKSFIEPGFNYVFAGFNALNSAEKIITEYYVHAAKAEMIWDADEFYVNDKGQEAGVFLRQNLELFPEKEHKFIENNLIGSKKTIKVTGTPLQLSQAKYTAQILHQMKSNDEQELQHTVVVTADENALPFVLESIPDDIDHINVTMGQKLKNSMVFSFISMYLRLHFRSAGNAKSQNLQKINAQELIKFLKHPLIKTYLGETSSFKLQSVVSEILNSNKLFYSINELSSLLKQKSADDSEFSEYFLNIFSKECTPEKLTEKSIAICTDLETLLSEDDVITKGMLQSMKNVLIVLQEYLFQSGLQMTLSGFEMLFQRLTSAVQIPFEGEPLGGLQIMGFLETRCLDFKNVILINVNEGFIPEGSKLKLTFIPFDLRRSFGLPLPSHKDAMYSYYFLRLMQRAENIWIVYNTEADPMSGKEKSRYIRQLEFELSQKAGKNWNVEYSILQVHPNQSNVENSNAGVLKTLDIITKTQTVFHKGFSATGLFNYLECPFRFYLHYLMNAKELVTSLSLSAESDIFGSVVHESLCQLYAPSTGKELDQLFFKNAFSDYKSIIKSLFEELYSGGDMTTGKNVIILRVAEQMVQNVLKYDKITSETQSVIPLMLEKPLQATLTSGGNTCHIYGKFDRVDLCGEITRIADYKTGKVDQLKIIKKGMNPETFDFNSLNGKQFQLLFYLLLYNYSDDFQKVNGKIPKSGIITLKKSNVAFMHLQFSDTENEIPSEFLHSFETFIASLISEIYNTNVPFYRTADTEKCKYCVYTSICNYFAPIINEEQAEE